MKASELKPVDESTLSETEKERKSSWVKRLAAESVLGRVVSSAVQTTKASALSVVCLSPWGDSSPLILPSIRFRDAAFETINIATGGTATLINPYASQASAEVLGSIGSNVLVEVGAWVAGETVAEVADTYLIEEPIEKMIKDKNEILMSKKVKTIKITLRYKHTRTDAALGFFQASSESTSSSKDIFSSIKDYLDVSVGWFCPYLNASGRTPAIPRKLTPDVVFAHGPFLTGDYEVAETLLKESARILSMSSERSAPKADPEQGSANKAAAETDAAARSNPRRRMIVTVLGLKPHRHNAWTSSARPGESVVGYQLLDGVPTLVVPVRDGAPLVAWLASHASLAKLWKLNVKSDGQQMENLTNCLTEFLELCVDWDRATDEKGKEGKGDLDRLRKAVGLIVEAAVRSGESDEVQKDVDGSNSGIAMFRLP